MQRKRWLRAFAAVSAAALVATACGGDDEEPAADATSPTVDETDDDTDDGETPGDGDGERASVDGTLRLGANLPQTGDLSILGPPMIKAVQLAQQQINEAGGVLGNDVELVEGDSGTNEDVASDTADRLIQSEQVDAMIGAASSRISLSIIDKVTGSETVMCSPSNTGAAFTTYEDSDPGYYFRTAPPDNLQGPALADVVVGDGHSQIAIIALNDEYGQGFAGFLDEAFTERDATVVADVAYDPAGTDFSSDVQTVLDADPDAVVLISFPDTGTPILSGLLEGGLTPEQIYTADGMQGTDVIEQVTPDDPSGLNGLKGTAPSSQGSEAFQTAFEEFAPDTDQIFSAHAYDCAIITALASAVADTDDPREFRHEMVGVTRDGEQCTTFEDCIALVEEGTDIDYDGASGAGDWVEAGEPSAGSYDVWEFRDGEINTLRTVDVE